MIWMKKVRFLVVQEQKFGARNHWALLEHSPTFSKISHCLKLNPAAYYNIPDLKSETNFQGILSLTALFTQFRWLGVICHTKDSHHSWLELFLSWKYFFYSFYLMKFKIRRERPSYGQMSHRSNFCHPVSSIG